jgi:DNA gyrase subunit B
LIVSHVADGTKSDSKLYGADLTKFMTHLRDYLDFYDKAVKRLRNEDATEAFAQVFALEGKDPVKRADFESQTKLKEMAKRLKEMARAHQFREVGEIAFDEEHKLYSVSFTDAQGAIRRIDWALASAPETRQMLAKFAQLRDKLTPPFYIEYAAKPAKGSAAATDAETAEEEAEAAEAEESAGEATAEASASEGTAAKGKAPKRGSAAARAAQDPVEKKTAREVFEYVIEQGKKEYDVQRYKGLGEMTAAQLWETTMDPERRTLLQVRSEDIAACEEIFTTLMGEDVEARRKFIEENALDVKNLDI